jgi:hypothetical protein
MIFKTISVILYWIPSHVEERDKIKVDVFVKESINKLIFSEWKLNYDKAVSNNFMISSSDLKHYHLYLSLAVSCSYM